MRIDCRRQKALSPCRFSFSSMKRPSRQGGGGQLWPPCAVGLLRNGGENLRLRSLPCLPPTSCCDRQQNKREPSPMEHPPAPVPVVDVGLFPFSDLDCQNDPIPEKPCSRPNPTSSPAVLWKKSRHTSGRKKTDNHTEKNRHFVVDRINQTCYNENRLYRVSSTQKHFMSAKRRERDGKAKSTRTTESSRSE